MLGPALSLALVGTIVTAVDHRARGARGCSTSRRSRGCCSARSSRPPTAPRSSRCCAARRCGAGWRARSRARRASTTRSRSCSCSASSSGSRSPDYGVARHGRRCSSQRARDRRCAVGLAVGWRRGAGVPRACGSPPAACTRSPRWRRPRSPSAPPTRCTARASSPSTSPGLALGSADDPARKRTITTFHEGLAWVAQLAMFLTLGLLVFPSAARRRRARGHGARARRRRSSRGRWRRVVATAPFALLAAERVVLGWAGPARRGAGRARDVPGDRGRPGQPRVLQHRVLRRRCSRRCCRARRSSRWRERLGVTTDEPALPRAARRGRARSGGSAPRWSSSRSAASDAVVGRARARARAAARRAAQRDRARRAGDPAARLDAAVEAGDRLHVLVRQEAAREFRAADRALARRARSAAGRPPPHAARAARRSSRPGPWTRGRRRPGAPARGRAAIEVVEQLRTRRDVPGALVVARRRPLRRHRARSSRSGPPRQVQTRRAGGCAARPTTPSARGGGRSSARGA